MRPHTVFPLYSSTADLVKFVMSLLVVMIHTTEYSLLGVERLAVPVFFLYSGYFLYDKLLASASARDGQQIYKNYIRRMLLLYALCEVIYSPFTISAFLSEGVTCKNLLLYMRNLLFVGEFSYSWHLWYLISSIYAILILMVLARKRKTMLAIICLLCTAYVITDSVFHLTETVRLHTVIFKYDYPRLSQGLMYISLGGGLAAAKSHLRNKALVAVLLFVVCVFLINRFPGCMFYLAPIASMSIVLASLSLNVAIPQRISRIVRKASTFIYLFHMLFVAILIEFVGFKHGVILWSVSILLSILAFLCCNWARGRKKFLIEL